MKNAPCGKQRPFPNPESIKSRLKWHIECGELFLHRGMSIGFAAHFVDLIASGRKTVTSRLIKAPVDIRPAGLTPEQRHELAAQCRWAPGDRVRVTVDDAPANLELEITDVAVKFVSEFTDAQASLEGFDGVRAFCDELARIYGAAAISEDRLMWVIAFRKAE